jgi:hypothetical protein
MLPGWLITIAWIALAIGSTSAVLIAVDIFARGDRLRFSPPRESAGRRVVVTLARRMDRMEFA